MIRSVTIDNNLGSKRTVTLRPPHDTGMIVKDITGLGPGKATINTRSLGSGDGAVFNSARMDIRTITFTFALYPVPTIQDARDIVYDMFPLKRPVRLAFDREDRTLHINGYVEDVTPTIFSEQEEVSVTVNCPEPYFRELVETGDGTISHTFTDTIPMFEFPFSNESLKQPLLILCDLKYRTDKVLGYRGDADVGFVLTLHIRTSADRFSITNVTTGMKLELDFSLVLSIIGNKPKEGDLFEVSTVRGERYIRFYRAQTKHWYNLFNCVKRQSKWPILVKGENRIAFDLSSTDTNAVTASARYFRLHLGV